MWTNGSSAAVLTPANARTTGNPSPSWPRGPVVIDRTGRSVSAGPAADTRGKASVSAVTAGISSLLELDYSIQPDRGPFIPCQALLTSLAMLEAEDTDPEGGGRVGRFVRNLEHLYKWLLLGVVIGVIAGLGAVIFYLALKYTGRFLLGYLADYHVPTP